VKALTLQAPWGWAITAAGKNIENRTWSPKIPTGVLIAIHAGKTWDKGAANHQALRAAMRAVLDDAEPWHQQGIVGVATFGGAHFAGAACTTACTTWGMQSGGDRPTWHWTVAGRPLAEPIPCRGALGLWTLPGDVELSVAAQIAQNEGDR
jgi:hypothetical protein